MVALVSWRSASFRRLIGVAAAVVVSLAITAGGVTPPLRAAVSGGIQACDALGGQPEESHAAGTLRVLEGDVTWVAGTGGVALVDVLPKTVVAAETVPLGGSFRFDLDPGRYILVASGEGNWSSSVGVTLGPGEDLRVDIPNDCI